MLTVYGSNVQVGELQKVEVKRPERAGRVWRGIKHYDLVTNIIGEITARGWSYGNLKMSLTEDQTALVGAMNINIPELSAPDGQIFSLGFVTDNAMRKTLRLVAGTTVVLCNNGMVVGDILLTHKHTNRFDLPGEVGNAVDRYFYRAEETADMTQRMQQYSLNAWQENEILTQAGRTGIVPWSKVGMVDKEYRNPTYKHVGGGRTSWGMYNAFTHVIKKSNPQRQMNQMNRFRQLLPMVTS